MGSMWVETEHTGQSVRRIQNTASELTWHMLPKKKKWSTKSGWRCQLTEFVDCWKRAGRPLPVGSGHIVGNLMVLKVEKFWVMEDNENEGEFIKDMKTFWVARKTTGNRKRKRWDLEILVSKNLARCYWDSFWALLDVLHHVAKHFAFCCKQTPPKQTLIMMP